MCGYTVYSVIVDIWFLAKFLSNPSMCLYILFSPVSLSNVKTDHILIFIASFKVHRELKHEMPNFTHII